MNAVETPMFPLGTVLVPTATMPLHVFEPRYRAMIKHCLLEQEEFGVVLIERGHEVGGGDDRLPVGCLARIDQFQEAPDGRYGLLCVGTQRIQVTDWLDDDPFPRAMTVRFPDRDDGGPEEIAEHSSQVATAVRAALRLAEELRLGGPDPLTELSSDPTVLGYQALQMTPVGPFDTYRCLEAASVVGRLRLVHQVVTEAVELLRMRTAPPADG